MTKEKACIKRSFVAYNIGVFLWYSAYLALFDLQSSINVEDGLGVTAVAVSITIGSVFAMLFVPVLVRKFGPKFWLIAGDAALLPYIVANLYPNYYTLLPASIILFTLECAMWPSMSLLNVLYASLYSDARRKNKEEYIMRFSGYFFFSYQFAQVFGNLISYAVLYGFHLASNPFNQTSQNVISTSMPDNIPSQYVDDRYGSCGANDCQNSSEISDNIDRYKPNNRASFFTLTGIIVTLQVLSIVVHIYFVPRHKSMKQNVKVYENNPLKENDQLVALLSKENDIDELLQNESGNESVKRKNEFVALCKTTLHHFTKAKSILLIPLTFYNGLAIAYASFELTRAFTSCTLGVHWVGICMAIYGFADSILAWVVGKFGRKLGHVCMYLIASIVECGNYMYCLHWTPGTNTFISICAIYFMFGCTDGVVQTMLNVTYIDFYSKDQDVALNIWNVLTMLGISLGGVLSTSLCVRSKIYFNMTVLIIGLACLVVADVLHKRENSKKLKLSIDIQESDAERL